MSAFFLIMNQRIGQILILTHCGCWRKSQEIIKIHLIHPLGTVNVNFMAIHPVVESSVAILEVTAACQKKHVLHLLKTYYQSNYVPITCESDGNLDNKRNPTFL